MKNNKLILTYILLLISIVTLAQSGGDYNMTKSTINNGGGISTSNNFTLNGSIGQTDASSESTGGAYSLTGGFWATTVPKPDTMFKDGFE